MLVIQVIAHEQTPPAAPGCIAHCITQIVSVAIRGNEHEKLHCAPPAAT